MPDIREFRESDWSAVRPLLHDTFAAGDTCIFPRDISEAEARKAWVELSAATFVALAWRSWGGCRAHSGIRRSDSGTPS